MNLVSVMWSLISTVLAGAFILIVLVDTQIRTIFHMSESTAIIAAAALGAIVAIPVAMHVTKVMTRLGPAA